MSIITIPLLNFLNNTSRTIFGPARFHRQQITDHSGSYMPMKQHHTKFENEKDPPRFRQEVISLLFHRGKQFRQCSYSFSIVFELCSPAGGNIIESTPNQVADHRDGQQDWYWSAACHLNVHLSIAPKSQDCFTMQSIFTS